MENDVKQFFTELAEIGDASDASLHVPATGEGETSSDDAAGVLDDEEGQLSVDVYERGAHIIVEAPIAGVQSDDVDVHITNTSLTIRGKRHREHTVRTKDYFVEECYWGRFSRSLELPEEVDADRAQATIKNGVLRIVMPKLHGGRR